MFAPRSTATCPCGFSAIMETDEAAKELFHAHKCQAPATWPGSVAFAVVVVVIVSGIVASFAIAG